MEYKYRTPDQPISLDELKSFLWGAATRLRGQIDAAGYKEYIFPLLFFKRISDVYDEQFSGFLAEGGAEYAGMQAEELAIRIPDGAHWDDVREVTENVGQRLVEAFIAIEQANPGEEADGRIIGGLDGIFGPKDGWTNKAKMPDHIITSLIEDFSRYNLSLAACPADEMGQAYEYLVGKFADDAGNTAQEFYTNRTVVDLMAEILQPKPGESIYDPTCGSGGMLVKCLDFLRKKGEPWQGVKVFGQEINTLTSSIARMNLYLNGVEDFTIANGDTLEHPRFFNGSQLRHFDIVLANPPYSIKQWNRDAFSNDKYGRNIWGTPIQARADYAFIQHIISSMDSTTGRSAILLPHGVLNREEDKDIRVNHVKSDTIDAIIGLGRNLFYNSGLESFIFICSNCKPEGRKNKILFIEAEKCTHKKGKQAYLFPEDIEKILNAYHCEEDIPGFSFFFFINEVLANEGNLNIKSYVKAVETENKTSLQENLALLTEIQNVLSRTLSELVFINDDLPLRSFEFADDVFDSSQWPMVKLSDVAEEYSIRIENPSASEFDFYIGSDCIGQYDFRIHKKSDASTITSTQKGFNSGDYLLVRRSLYGSDFRERAPRADFNGVCSADILTIREKKEIIADGFLIYVLYQKKLWDYIVANSNGGLTRRIKWKQLADYEFPLPPYQTQKTIADKLWAAYRLKESYKKLLSATDEMVKSQFIEMFSVMPTTPVKTYVDDSFPGEWGTEDTMEAGVKVIRTTNFTNSGKLNLADVVTRSIEDRKIARKQIKKYDTILERSGGTADNPVGRVVLFEEDDLFLCNNFTQVLRFKDIDPRFAFYSLYYFYQTNKTAIRSMGSKTTGIQNLNMSKYLEIGIPNASDEEQKEFVAIAEQADKSKFELRKSIKAIDAVIKSLING